MKEKEQKDNKILKEARRNIHTKILKNAQLLSLSHNMMKLSLFNSHFNSIQSIIIILHQSTQFIFSIAV
jgi:hypothetical protein